MELKNFVFLVNVLCWGGYLVSFGMIKDTFPTVNCGYVSSKGHRTNQRDAVVHSSFVVHAVSYDMAMICDGCGKDNFAVNVVKDNMSGALQMALCNSQNDVKMAILWAFDNCEEVILKRQEDTLNASGVRIFLSLWDLTHKKEYLAQLGDCRLYILDNFRNIICETRDHKPSDKKEKTYIERCGGRVRYNGTYVGLISDNPAAYGLTTSRALGCAHLKQNKEYLYRPKRGPVNAVPDVWYLDLQGSGAVEMLITSGYTKIVDAYQDKEAVKICLRDAFSLSGEDFYNKYKCFKNDDSLWQFKVDVEDCKGDTCWSYVAARIIYALPYFLGQNKKMDNVTILLRSCYWQ